jgi:hypothetical protein
MTEDVLAEPATSSNARETVDRIRTRLFRGEHLNVVRDYLEGRLKYSQSDWEVAALISLAMRHHFATLNRDGKLTVDVRTEQVGDGLAITVKWPDDSAIDEVDVAFEIMDDTGNLGYISRRFEREKVAGQGASRIFGRSLASNQTVVLRPIRAAATVSTVARLSHRLRFDGRFLAPSMRSCFPETEVVAMSDFDFEPVAQAPSSVVDVYHEARGREVLEIITLAEQREREHQEQIRRRRELLRSLVKAVVLVVLFAGLVFGALLLIARFVPDLPEWFPFKPSGIESLEPQEPGVVPSSLSVGISERQWHG